MAIASNTNFPLQHLTVAAYRFGRPDPTTIIDGSTLWRATLTPLGPATVKIEGIGTTPFAEFFGPGADWLKARYDALLGDDDVIPDLVAHHDVVKRAQKRFQHLALGRTETPYHEIIPAVLGQRVTAGEAVRQWQALVTQFGERAPGPHPTLRVPPTPDVLARLGYVTFHEYGIERKRADTIRNIARVSHFLIRDWPSNVPAEQHTHSLMNLPGVGPWTAAVAGSVAFGDPDALAVGDFHLKNTVAWALHGIARGTDEQMLESLAPYVGHRHRVVRWLQLMGYRAPARGPRRPIVSITQL